MGKMIKWYLITALVGSTPMILRAFFYLFLNDKSSFQLLTVYDPLTWGLVLSISIFNDRDRYLANNPGIGYTAAAFSVGLMIAIAVTYIIALVDGIIPSMINRQTLFWMSIILALGSFIVGFIFVIFCSPHVQSKKRRTKVNIV